jgi:hypothetical protein
MSTVNVYFTHGTRNEQMLKEDLIIESIRIWGQEFRYIPRKLVSKDNILGEDRLSKFVGSFPIEMYLETYDGFEGQGAFIQKFGLAMEQSATLTVARRRWDQLVGRYGVTTVPTRPNEGDLIYFPLTGGLFEIKFVKHQDPFYQLNDLASYKLEVELFQYSSEFIDTGDRDVDEFETLKTFNTNTTRTKYGELTRITMTNNGSGYTSVPDVEIVSSTGSGATATAVLGTGASSDKVVSVTVNTPGTGYRTAPTINIIGGGGSDATATSVISADIDRVEEYPDNNEFGEEAGDVLFDVTNPFGEVK